MAQRRIAGALKSSGSLVDDQTQARHVTCRCAGRQTASHPVRSSATGRAPAAPAARASFPPLACAHAARQRRLAAGRWRRSRAPRSDGLAATARQPCASDHRLFVLGAARRAGRDDVALDQLLRPLPRTRSAAVSPALLAADLSASPGRPICALDYRRYYPPGMATRFGTHLDIPDCSFTTSERGQFAVLGVRLIFPCGS